MFFYNVLSHFYALCIHDQYPHCMWAFTSEREREEMMHNEWMKYLKIRMFTHTHEGNVNQMQNTDVEPRKNCQKGSSVMCARAQHLLINSSPEMNTRWFSLFQQSRRQNICNPDQQAPFKEVCKYQPGLIKHFQQAKWGQRFLLLWSCAIYLLRL